MSELHNNVVKTLEQCSWDKQGQYSESEAIDLYLSFKLTYSNEAIKFIMKYGGLVIDKKKSIFGTFVKDKYPIITDFSTIFRIETENDPEFNSDDINELIQFYEQKGLKASFVGYIPEEEEHGEFSKDIFISETGYLFVDHSSYIMVYGKQEVGLNTLFGYGDSKDAIFMEWDNPDLDLLKEMSVAKN